MGVRKLLCDGVRDINNLDAIVCAGGLDIAQGRSARWQARTSTQQRRDCGGYERAEEPLSCRHGRSTSSRCRGAGVDAAETARRADALGPEDLSDLIFTSGTTGHPKGVAVRHANASSVPNSTPSWSGGLWLHASPLATFAGITFVYTPMKLGLRGIYQPKFDVGRWLNVVAVERPVAIFLVPAMAHLLLDHPAAVRDLERPALAARADAARGRARGGRHRPRRAVP